MLIKFSPVIFLNQGILIMLTTMTDSNLPGFGRKRKNEQRNILQILFIALRIEQTKPIHDHNISSGPLREILAGGTNTNTGPSSLLGPLSKLV